MTTISNLLDHLRTQIPLDTAADWDNVGLLLGDADASVERVMTCLTVTPESAQEAIDERVQLIVSHHPVLFRATKKLTTQSSEGRMLWNLARAGVAVFSPHTAFDNAKIGINELLAKRLGLQDVRPLRQQDAATLCKIAVFVPDSDLAKVSDALFTAGAGRIGEYRECSFQLKGTGTFFGSEASNPTLGQKGRREEVAEIRLEVVCPESQVDRAVEAMCKAHSYEEPAFDVIRLRPRASVTGVGRVGNLSQATSLGDFSEQVRMAVKVAALQVVGPLTRPVSRVAIVCGAGGEFIHDAIRTGADVLLTGEARFHDCLAAQAQNVAMVLPGHYASERPGIEDLAERLQTAFPSLAIWPSRRECDPLQVVGKTQAEL